MTHLLVATLLVTSATAPAGHDWQPVLRSPNQTLTLVDKAMTKRLDDSKMMVWLKEDYSRTVTPLGGTQIRKVRYDCIRRTRRFIASSSFSPTGQLTSVRNVDAKDQKDLPIARGSEEDVILKFLCR